MRIRLLLASIIDRTLYALNVKTNGENTSQEDVERAALLGDEHSIRQQTIQARAFADEIGQRVRGEPPRTWWK